MGSEESAAAKGRRSRQRFFKLPWNNVPGSTSIIRGARIAGEKVEALFKQPKCKGRAARHSYQDKSHCTMFNKTNTLDPYFPFGLRLQNGSTGHWR